MANNEDNITVTQTSKISLDVKTLVGIIVGILGIAAVYFTLQSKISQLQLDVIRMQDTTTLNTEFRVKWHRGELGALPDDAKQDCFTLVLKTVKNFKPRKGTAFNYFTTIVVNNLKLMYTREKKYNQKIDKYIESQKDKIS